MDASPTPHHFFLQQDLGSKYKTEGGTKRTYFNEDEPLYVAAGGDSKAASDVSAAVGEKRRREEEPVLHPPQDTAASLVYTAPSAMFLAALDLLLARIKARDATIFPRIAGTYMRVLALLASALLPAIPESKTDEKSKRAVTPAMLSSDQREWSAARLRVVAPQGAGCAREARPRALPRRAAGPCRVHTSPRFANEIKKGKERKKKACCFYTTQRSR